MRTTLTDERALSELVAVVRPEIATLRHALADVMFAPGRQAVADLLAVAPVDSCVRLAEAWSTIREAGYSDHQVLSHFDPEEQFLIELVTSVYSQAPLPSTGGTDLHELAGLLDETTRAGSG